MENGLKVVDAIIMVAGLEMVAVIIMDAGMKVAVAATTAVLRKHQKHKKLAEINLQAKKPTLSRLFSQKLQ
jgi:hypothetical protein